MCSVTCRWHSQKETTHWTHYSSLKAKKDDDEESEESGDEEVDDDGYQFVEKVGLSKIHRIRYMERGRIIHISGLLHRL